MRVFAALPLPGPAARRLQQAARSLKERCPGLRVVRPEGFHLTLIFFGELEGEPLARVRAMMALPELRRQAFRASLGGAGRFPPRGNPRVIYCRVGDESGRIRDCYRTLVEAVPAEVLRTLRDLKREEEFVPHITVARNRSGRLDMTAIEPLFAFEEPFVVDRLALYRSILKPGGAQYEVLETASFSEADA